MTYAKRWLALVLAIFLLIGNEVIAAQDVIDQSPASSQMDATNTSQTQPADLSSQVLELPSPTQAGFSILDGLFLLEAAGVMVLFFAMRWNRFNRIPSRTALPSPAIGLFLLLLMMLAGQVGALLVRSFADLPVPANASSYSLKDLAKLSIGAYTLQAIVAGVYFTMTRSANTLVLNDAKNLADRKSQFKAIGLGAVALLGTWPIVNLVANLVAAIRGGTENPIAHDTLQTFAQSPIDSWFIIMAALVVFITPVLEEIAYRGLLQTSLVTMHMPRWLAIALTSAIFSLMHAGIAAPHAIVALFVLSLALGWAYEKSGRLAAPITMHMLFNAGNLAMTLMTLHA